MTLQALYEEEGTIVTVERCRFRLAVNVKTGEARANGRTSSEHLAQARAHGQATLRPGDIWEILPEYTNENGLPAVMVFPDQSVQFGQQFYLLARPDGQILTGGPELAQRDLLSYGPDDKLVFGGAAGVAFDKACGGWTQLLKGVVLGLSLAPVFFQAGRGTVRLAGLPK